MTSPGYRPGSRRRFEQVAHRLTTLSRPTARGVPFFLMRVDQAGNVSKRYASGAFPFARFGGACPRWRLHAAFRTPGRLVTQIIETPDGRPLVHPGPHRRSPGS